jgi:hypothetical protein
MLPQGLQCTIFYKYLQKNQTLKAIYSILDAILEAPGHLVAGETRQVGLNLLNRTTLVKHWRILIGSVRVFYLLCMCFRCKVPGTH